MGKDFFVVLKYAAGYQSRKYRGIFKGFYYVQDYR